jgi:hypothetical protein
MYRHPGYSWPVRVRPQRRHKLNELESQREWERWGCKRTGSSGGKGPEAGERVAISLRGIVVQGPDVYGKVLRLPRAISYVHCKIIDITAIHEHVSLHRRVAGGDRRETWRLDIPPHVTGSMEFTARFADMVVLQ